jgi:ribonuclease-3
LTTRQSTAERSRRSPGRQSVAAAGCPDGSAEESAPETSEASTPLVTPDDRFFDYTFKDRGLLTLALTHSSLAYESNPEGTPDPGSDNERLEFLGDAVLGLVVAEALYLRLPALREGDLTRLRASLVSSRHLAQVAQRIQLGPMLLLGRGEAHSGGHKKPALLANALEAVIAALYLDGGLAAAREFIHRHIIEPAEDSLVGVLHSSEPFSGAVGDYKSALQERLQAAGHGQPQYILTAQSGPDHQKRFRIEVRVAGPDGTPLTLASADGTTKKQAQQEAARLAFARLIPAAQSSERPKAQSSERAQSGERPKAKAAPAPAADTAQPKAAR